MLISLSYDKDKNIDIEIPEKNILDIIKPNFPKVLEKNEDIILKAIQNPIGSPPLRNLVSDKSKVAIVITDKTRYALDREISIILLKELERGGVKKENISFFIALGSHEPMSSEEIKEKLGEEISSQYPVYNHEFKNEEELLYLGDESRLPMYINKKLMEHDIKITLGVIEPHLFAGYSGGVKTICIGLAGYKTLSATHSLQILSHESTKLGVIEGNIFRNFLNEMAKKVKVDFIVNLILNQEKRVVSAFSGHPIKAFEKGVEFAKKIFEISIKEEADVVISCPGYPKSINLYQATRSANSVVLGEKPVVKKNGKILIPATCEDGLGDENYYRLMSQCKSLMELKERIWEEGFNIGEHKAFVLERILSHAEVIITDCKIEEAVLNKMFLKKESTLQEAVNKILKINPNFKFLIMPQGIITLPKLVGGGKSYE
ncbi:MAG: nickel-dependent lactate racemase [Dictyoglomaceae bacterium]|nr:nickel-dependent lactate racemase [Dictyoglomaceae bacterium]